MTTAAVERRVLGQGPRPEGDYEDCSAPYDPDRHWMDDCPCGPCARNYARSLRDSGVDRIRYQQARCLSETFAALAAKE